MKSGGDTRVDRFFAPARELWEAFATKGYVTQEDVRHALPHARDGYVEVLTYTSNNEANGGFYSGDEYVDLNRISGFYRPLLDYLRSHSPLFEYFRRLVARMDDASLNVTERDQARRTFENQSWSEMFDLPNSEELKSFLAMAGDLLKKRGIYKYRLF